MKRTTKCQVCTAEIKRAFTGPAPQTCSARCRQAKCRERKNEAGKGGAKAFTWEMIRAAQYGVVVKTDTPSGRRYLERKEIDKKRGRRVSQITSSVSHVTSSVSQVTADTRDSSSNA